MDLEDKFLNSMGLPARIQSVREAIKYFDENPVLASRKPIAEVEAPRGESARFRHPPAGELMGGDLRKAPMHYRGTLTDTTRFSKQPQLLPSERLKPTTAHDKLSDNIALRMKRDLQRRMLRDEHEAAGIVGNADHESGGFGALRGNLWQQGRDTGRDEGNAFGFLQWDKARREAFKDWAKQNGYNTESYEANYGFLEHELLNTPEKKVLNELSQADTADDAARIVERVYLRSGKPKLAERQKLARRAMNLPNYEPPVPTPRPVDAPPWSQPWSKANR
ncbi:phage tail tip lysozyme [Ensifer sp. LBL]|uniref:phage tail tip lysozyme n=1 Tax=Ensifer sp. LBL TaxID=2991056 RepID=UPI003D1CA599